jgi:serralysin
LGSGAVLKNSASPFVATLEFGEDIVLGFENVTGGSGGDWIFGNSAANKLFGDNGNDILAGYGGNDIISGGDGGDGLSGGAGADQLSGGSGQDDFAYTALTDSGAGFAKRDRISDFTDGDDLIFLQFDSNTKVAGHQNFTFVSGDFAVFTGTAGQLRCLFTLDGWMVEGDVNGDAKADFQIEVVDETHLIDWDFSVGLNTVTLE